MKINKYEIARKLGVSHQSVYKWFSGKCMPRLDKVKKLAQICEISVDELLDLLKK